jgi:hypothetical protein
MFRDSGWGLYPVDRLADRWAFHGRRTTVWASLAFGSRIPDACQYTTGSSR